MDGNLLKIRHDRSVKDFPFLTLDDDEYVEFAFKRAKIWLLMIIGTIAAAISIVLFAFLMILMGQSYIDATARNFLYLILALIIVFGLIAAWIAVIVYRGNQMFITNKRVIQLIMKSPVVKSVNMIDLPSVEDASFHQTGFLQTTLHYGTFRLSTVGDETTYTFPYSDISSADLRAVSKLITSAKEKVKKEDK